MKKLRLCVFARNDFLDDVFELQEQLKRAGYDATQEDISFAWECVSGSQYAQWLGLSENEEDNVNDILEYFKEEENEWI